MTPAHWLLANAALAAGALVQGAAGFGYALVVAPLLVLINPALVPGPMLVTTLLLTLLMTRREWHAVRATDLIWSLPGRVVGTTMAVLVFTLVPPERMALGIGVVVLAAVLVAASGVHIAISPRALFGAGTVSGFMATISAIGGPPMVLLYQRESGPRIRATLAAYFATGIVISLAALHLVGRFGRSELTLAAGLLPGVIPGFLLSHRLARWLDGGYTRAALLVISAASSVVIIVRELL